MAKPARRRCKNDEFREWFHPAFANQWWCSPECGTKIALERRSKEREKAEKAAEKKRRREEQKQKDKLKIRKLALKPRSYWIKQAQQAVNAFIRERDRDFRSKVRLLQRQMPTDRQHCIRVLVVLHPVRFWVVA